MINNEIQDILIDNDLDNIEELSKYKECIVMKFDYIFDDIELEGAESYADEECTRDKKEEWYEEYFLPYLNDMAIDNVNDIIDEISEDMDLDYEMLSYELSEEEYNSMRFLVAFYNGELPVNIDDLIMEL